MGIESGSFMMGALPNDKDANVSEKPRHKVTLTKRFWMSKYPCTQDLYQEVMGTNPSHFKGSNRPVEQVSWCDAVLFCNRLSELEGLKPCYVLPKPFENDDDWSQKVWWNKSAKGYRLPTEAEWEYCARGGEEHLYSGSDNIDEVAWYGGGLFGGGGTVKNDATQNVGQKKGNGYGIHDMSGNVDEWVWDTHDEKAHERGDVTDPCVDKSSPLRVRRGGSWDDGSRFTRVSSRIWNDASYGYDNLGFLFLRTV